MYLLGGLMVLAGLNHFRDPDFYLKIMPPFLPWHEFLVALSGVFEVVLGLMVFVPQWRKLAIWGIIALLIAVFPANIYMALENGAMMGDDGWQPIIAWARLPLQFLLIYWVYSHRRD
ncbi:MAG: MauE/DoxX family redox-associated membrane protein [Bacteroidota bacterium]